MSIPNPSGAAGVFGTDKEVLLLYTSFDSRKKSSRFHVATSSDGMKFSSSEKVPTIAGPTRGSREEARRCEDLYISRLSGKYLLTYLKKVGRTHTFRIATSIDGLHWTSEGTISGVHEPGAVIPNFEYRGERALLFGATSLHLALSKNLKSWKQVRSPILKPRRGQFDSAAVAFAGTFLTTRGIAVLYIGTDRRGHRGIGAAVLDPNDLTRVRWRTEFALWEAPLEWKSEDVHLVGCVHRKEHSLVYWEVRGKGILVAPVPAAWRDFRVPPLGTSEGLKLKKSDRNPLIAPHPGHRWESQATFNAAAAHDGGAIHLLYRAIGDDGVSVLGYAASRDGIHIDERLPEPAYVPTRAFEGPQQDRKLRVEYVSGGGYGGCEDPRLTRIGNRYYMTYVAFNGWDLPRVALTSIDADDFLNKRWTWAAPVLISPPGVIDKNACILPEKVRGKYVVFHRVFPNIQIDFVDDLDAFDGQTTWLKPHGDAEIRPRPTMWDSRKVGAGAPPLKTRDGWLLIYQAIGNQDASRYKIGAMLLDLKDPTVVLARSKVPIVEPVEPYENEGHKWGVVYPCGAVEKDGELFVYYGGADKVTCVATAPLQPFVDELKRSEKPTLSPIHFA